MTLGVIAQDPNFRVFLILLFSHLTLLYLQAISFESFSSQSKPLSLTYTTEMAF